MTLESIVNALEAVFGLCFAIALVACVFYFYLVQPALHIYPCLHNNPIICPKSLAT